MAFDSKTVGASPGEAFALSREFGRTFVPLDSAPPEFRLLDQARGASLNALADVLVPGDGHWPSASDVGAAQYADNSASLSPILRRELSRAVDLWVELSIREHGARPEEIGEDLPAVVADYETAQPALFEFILELVFEGYYRHPHVQAVVEERTRYKPAVPVTGMKMEPFDESRVDAMKARPRRVREEDA